MRASRTLLEDQQLEEPVRKRSSNWRWSHSPNSIAPDLPTVTPWPRTVMVDLKAGVAQWFEFETIHESTRPTAWRRADDVRALLATCLLQTIPERIAETLHFVLDVYADEEMTDLLATSFSSVLRRPLIFHLAQAGLSFQCFRNIARLIRERLDE